MASTDLPPVAPAPREDPNAPAPPAGIRASELPRQAAATAHARQAYLPDARRRGVALCLSGGGYRAALFHLGAVRRLNELGVLGQLDTIASVSGGSILAAHLASRMGPAWPPPGAAFPDFDRQVAEPFHAFCRRNIRTLPLLIGLLSKPLPGNWDGHVAVGMLERLYRRHLTRLRLAELPARPRFVICATDMAYGVNWTFSRDRVGSYMAGYAAPPANWSVARAVAASSCFPPFFNPQPIGLEPSDLRDGKDASPERAARIDGLRLSDGGVYDNMGLEPVWRTHAVVLVSEGGSTFDAGGDRGLFWRLGRYVDIIGRQAGALRKRWLVSNFVKGAMRGTYWGIGTDIANYDVEVVGYPAELAATVIAKVRTDLDAFGEAERKVLENHGYLLAAAAMQRHADFLVDDPVAPAAAPHPEWLDADQARRGLADSHRRKLPFGRR